jgi:methylmalonyl-CoA/ethylmalonyl-CoA epimerase
VTSPSFFGPNARLHHVGVAVKSVTEAGSVEQSWVDPTQGVEVAFIKVHGLTIELVAPATEHSPVDESLKAGIKLVHLCFEVPCLNDALEHSRKSGFHRVRPVTEAVAFGGRRITWVYHPTFGLCELLEASIRDDRGRVAYGG